MRLTWTFYPNGQPSVTLTVIYVPRLDGPDNQLTGYLEVDTNTAYVNWSGFRIFNSDDQPTKRALFESLTRVDTFTNPAESDV
jgi:hypothetical protein